MNASSVDVKDMLIDGLGFVFGTNIFVGRMPTAPDNCTVIYDTPGAPPQLTYMQGEDYFRPAIQIQNRNRSYATGFESIQDIKDFLHAKGHETWNGTEYSLIQCSGDPALLKWDEKNRAIWVINFNIQRY